MASCPCCSNSMLRHIQNRKIHWFCRTCWAEMPLLELKSNILDILTEDLATYQKRQSTVACPLLTAFAEA